jgi:RimJ/RimL family protein N-acetyltransferase
MADIRSRLAHHYPPLGLRVTTPRLVLQMPTDEDLLTLLDVAERGIHDPADMPFLVPWTDTPSPQRERDSLSHWWGIRSQWSPGNWNWNGAVYLEGEPIGVQNLQAHHFAQRRQVSSGSWIGQEFQGRGIGREMRAAVLHLAFAGLGAILAHSGYLAGNAASRRVSEELGYVANGFSYETIRGELVRVESVVLERSAWEARRRDDITIEGLEPCLEMFGASGTEGD